VSSKEPETEPFYFKSYEQTIGVSRDVNELQTEFSRLARENPAALEYHIKERHIIQWLNTTNEKELAKELEGVNTVEEIIVTLGRHVENKQVKGEQPNVPVVRRPPERKRSNGRKRSSKKMQ
jgi:hypothetical protein